MSADEFDQGIERLFSRAPDLADAKAFDARLMARLQNDTRTRSVVLTCAGLIGGLIAVKELAGVSFRSSDGRFEAVAGSGDQAPSSALLDGAISAQTLMDGFGITGMDLGSVTQTQSFLGVACVLIAVLTLGAVKLYQQV